MLQQDSEAYIEIAKNTAVFKASELEVLRELVIDFQNNQESNYFLLEERIDTKIAGFIIFGRVPMTDFSWDIYWLVVDKDFQRKGIGKSLLKRTTQFLLQRYRAGVLRVETSSQEGYSAARNFYLSQGFKELGKIPHFYAQGDDLLVFYKDI